MRSLLVVGTGLIGTSVALAARASGATVWLDDERREHLDGAVAMGAGQRWEGAEVEHAVVCVPPLPTATVVCRLLALPSVRTVSDTASVKQRVVDEVAVATRAGDFVGGHPMAGSEQSGPWSARPDLFRGRPWVLTPAGATDAAAIDRASTLARLCGADVVVRSPEEHDDAVAAVSHLPQLLSSVLAAALLRLEPDALALAGQGVRDMTRIAASDAELWSGIVTGNRAAVADVLSAVHTDLGELLTALQAGADPSTSVRDLVARGNAGHERLPGKHGGALGHYVTIGVLVPDRPGELGRAFTTLGSADVNIEEVQVDHAPGRPVGLLRLAVLPERADDALTALAAAGFRAQREQ